MQNTHPAQKPMQNFYFFRRQHAVSLDTNRFGGAERDRTADPLLAKQVLSQLSYSPISSIAPNFFGVRQLPRHRLFPAAPCVAKRRSMVGPGRLELPTPRLSSVCSNQLSYGPILVKPVQTAKTIRIDAVLCLLEERETWTARARHTIRMLKAFPWRIAFRWSPDWCHLCSKKHGKVHTGPYPKICADRLTNSTASLERR